MKNQWVTSIAIIAALSIPVSAVEAGGQKKFMRSYDINSDGTVTLEEFNEATSTRFDSMDADSNSFINADEFANYIKARRMSRKLNRHKEMDDNNDGNITKEEFLTAKQERAERKFDKMDKNQDEVLTAGEIAEFMKRKMHKKGRFGKGGSRRDVFQQMDGDRDGNVTRAESQSVWSGWFNRLDQNGDSVVTADEVKKARSMRRNRKE